MIRRLFAVLVVIALSALLAWAGSRAVAAWYYETARSELIAMHEAGEVEAAAFERGSLAIDRALDLVPGHPDYLELAGRLRERLASRPGMLGAAGRVHLEAAAAYYAEAVSARPTWPHGWVNVLRVKDRLGEFDPAFRLALDRAATTGGFTPLVQLQVISSGLRYWDRLNADERALVRRVIRSAIETQPRQAIDLVRSYGRLDLLCEAHGDHPRLVQQCGGA